MFYEISLEESEKWEIIVKKFPNYDIYYLPDYVKAFQIHGDGKPILFYYEGMGLQAVNAVLLRDLAENDYFLNKLETGTYFDIATPYGYGGFLLKGAITQEGINALEAAYTAYCKEKGIISEFVRFHPLLQNQKNLTEMYQIEKLGSTVAVPLESKEQIYANLSPNNRNKLRKAQKAGVTIDCGNSLQLYEQFMEMYEKTMKRNQANGYYYFRRTFFDSIRKDLKEHALLFYAVCNEKIIAMSIFLFANGKMHYHLSALEETYKKLAPVNLLIYKAALYGSEHGYQELHLGGGLGSREDSLFEFKIGFYKNGRRDFLIGKKIIDGKTYQELVDMRNYESINADYFPLYRG